MAPTDSNELTEEFIHCYRSHSVLWDVTSKDYFRNRSLKRAAYEALLKVLQKYKQNASLAEVKRKINTLRCTYRKELKKVVQSESTVGADASAGVKDVYVPSLWWFDSMSFLKLSVSAWRPESVENEDESCNETVHSPTPKRKRSNSKELSFMAYERLAKDKSETTGNREGDQFVNIARTWADKLRSLSRKRQLIVEKQINDTFFEAQLAELFPEEEEKSEHSSMSDSRVTRRTPTRSNLVTGESFTAEQRAFCIKEVYKSNDWYEEVPRMFREQYGLEDISQSPSDSLIKTWVENFEGTGSTHLSPSGPPLAFVKTELMVEPTGGQHT